MRVVLPEPFDPSRRWLEPGEAAKSTGPRRGRDAPPPGGRGAEKETPSSRITGSRAGPGALVEEGAHLVHHLEQRAPRLLRDAPQVVVLGHAPLLARGEDGGLDLETPDRRVHLGDRARQLHATLVTHPHADRRGLRE